MNNAPIKLFCAVFKILILFTLEAIIVIKLVYHTSIKFRMFSFAWQLTVVNRTETKQRSICPVPSINYGIFGFIVEVINMGHSFTEHLFSRLGTFAFPILECLLYRIKIKHCAWNKVNSLY